MKTEKQPKVPKITNVSQTKKGDRVNVYLDGKFYFSASLELVVKYNLQVGREVSQNFLDNIQDKDEEEKIYARIVRFATIRPRSEKEIKDWFKRKKILPRISESLFIRLKRLNLVDDKNFAKWWVEQRMAFKNYSTRRIKWELAQKGIARDIVDETIADLDNMPSEESLARKALEKKIKLLARYSSLEKRKKLYGFLSRQGFSWEVTAKVVDEMLQKKV